MSEDTVIFLHIPKTGGRSLENILLRKYSKEEVLVNVHKQMGEIAEWPDERKRKVRYLQGHFAYGAHEVFPQGCRYITMLREPVERVISLYYFLKRTTSHPLCQVIANDKMGLEEFLTSGISDEISNDQTRLIAGVSTGAQAGAADMLELAKNNIENKFILAGLVEKFDDTLVLLKRRLGLKNIYYGIRNQTINRPMKEEISESALSLICERNQADLDLYAFAKDRMDEEIRNEHASFQRDVKIFKFINRPYSNMFHVVRVMKNKLARSQ